MQAVASGFSATGGEVHAPRAATSDELARIHTRAYIGAIAGTVGRATALDADTFTSPDTYEVACLAAGAAIVAAEHAISQPHRRAMALVRPPGHHAETDRAMGFCFFNNVAVAAAHARAQGLDRVAIVDYDVHHGNGTQWSFYGDPSVLFISSHQFPYYPGTGAATEIGTGEGAGFTINLPLAAGATDADYELVYSRVAIPALRQFKPELILISAGFDAYMDDPLGGMRLTAECFGRLTSMIAGAADECCDGRLVAITEGGYHLEGLADSLRATIDALSGSGQKPGLYAGDTRRGEATLKAVLPVLSAHWKL